MWWWWLAWLGFVIVFLALPWGYGWRRHGWGPPYPSYYRHRSYVRRGPFGPVAPEPSNVVPAHDAYAGPGWTWLADVFWLAILGAIAWAIYLAAT